MKIYNSAILILLLVSAFSCTDKSQDAKNEKPVIKKLGAIDCDLVETMSIVFQNRVYRFEYVRQGYEPNQTADSCLRFVDHETGEATHAFAQGYHFLRLLS